MRQAWEGAGTEHPTISFLFEDGAPYLTIWDDKQCKCRHGRILENVYDVPGHKRTAQAFVCTIPGEGDEEGIDVVNVHAPSGHPKLTDKQRFQLIRNLLQSSSMTRANRPISEGRFLIGGDMNTPELTLGQMLEKLETQRILKRKPEVRVPLNGLHGDMCVVGGFTTTMVQGRARNHDPKHVPYGIAWRKQPQHATEQLTTTPPSQTQIPTAPDTTTESRATTATAAAVPTGTAAGRRVWRKQRQPDPQVVPVRPERQPSHLPLEKVSPSAWPATEQPEELDHIGATTPQTEVSYDADTGTTRHATEQLTTTPQTQIPTAPDTTTESRATGATAAAVPTGMPSKQTRFDSQVVTVHLERQLSQPPLEKASASAWPATEQPDEPDEPDEQPDEPDEPDEPPDLNGPGQQMAYVIVNAFLDNVTFENTDAERLIKDVILQTGEVIQPDMLFNVDAVFRPIFFHYPNGLKDRTRAEPRNAFQYIRQWRDIAAWRQMWGLDATQHATEQLTKLQVQGILHEYIDNFIRTEATDTQRDQTWTKNKSKAEAQLRRFSGSTMMAKLIWQLGLPNISEVLPATEQQRDSIATATVTILNWLSMLANLIQEHKATPTYQEHARKSGTQKNKSGLNETELRMKEEKKRAARLKYGRQPSTASGSNTWQASGSHTWH
jgi:hypothetical protein